MTAELNVTLAGEKRVVARGTRVHDVLDGARGRDIVAARVNGNVVDLSRALTEDANVEPVPAD
ncbi:MAG: hypothetical protein ACREQF_01690, partial [Candidatus Binataceae bacterium]